MTRQPLGLKILFAPPLSNDTSVCTNIIFVHGLGGHREKTWTYAESNAFWPSWLHNVEWLENTRVMAFGYDADYKFWKPRTVLSIRDFGDQLLADLLIHYSKYGYVIL